MTDNSGLVVAALQKTNPELALAIDATNSWKAGVQKRGARVQKYRKYERGDHDANITAQMKKMLRLSTQDDSGLSDFSINYMRIVIDKMSSRIKVSEITTGGKNKEQNAYISGILADNDFDSLQGALFRAAIRDGDSYVMIDPATLKWIEQPAYDGFSGVVAIFDSMSPYPIWACKVWSEAVVTKNQADEEPATTTTMRLNVYTPDQITEWLGKVGGQEIEQVTEVKDLGNGAGEVSTNVIPWGQDVVPIIHFVNLRDNYTQYGESELRVAIPPQDVLNRTLHSMVMASEFAAFKVAWAIGMEVDKSGITPGSIINMVLTDEEGKTATSLSADQIEFLKAVRIGEFAETNISNYTIQLEQIVRQISQATQTPIYGVTAEGNLSGEALKQLEIGLIGKIKRFQNDNTEAIRTLIEMTAHIQSTFDVRDEDGESLGDAPELDEISVHWQSPEILDVNAAIAGVLLIREKAPGLFDDDFLRTRIGALLNMTQDQITTESEKAKAVQEATMDSLLNRGGPQAGQDQQPPNNQNPPVPPKE